MDTEDKDELLEQLDNLLEASKYYFYSDTKEYVKACKKIEKMKKHIKKDNFDKVIRKDGG